MIAFYDNKPSATEAVGNGNYLYRWNIEQVTIQNGEDEGTHTQWKCEEATISGMPEYGKCIVAVIRTRYSSDDELALLNKYNSYKQGIIEDASIETEYAEYLTYVKAVKEQVKTDLNIESNEVPPISKETIANAASVTPKGTIDDPIPYEQGMTLSKGKYYTQYDVLYLCSKGMTSGKDSDLYQLTNNVAVVDKDE